METTILGDQTATAATKVSRQKKLPGPTKELCTRKQRFKQAEQQVLKELSICFTAGNIKNHLEM